MERKLSFLTVIGILILSGSGAAQDRDDGPSPRECVPADSATADGKLAGYVVHVDTEDVVPAARITLERTDDDGIDAASDYAIAVSDSEGRFWFCDVPTEARVTLRATGPAGGSATASLVMSDGFVRHDVTLRRTPGGMGTDLLFLVLDAETERPVNGAIVRIPAADRLAIADERGRVRIDGFPSGSHEFRVEHMAYGEQVDTLRVRERHAHLVKVYLAPQPFVLEPIQVTVEYRPQWLVETGFYRRKEMGLGYHMSPEEIEWRNPSRFSHLLEPAPGVRLVRECDPYCTTLLRTAATRTRACSPEIYMDGKKLRLPAEFSLDDVPVWDVAAIEMYTRISQTPPQFYGLCGSLVIWTKRFES